MISEKISSMMISSAGGGRGVGTSWILGGVCYPIFRILTRFQSKKCHFSHPFSDLAFRQKLCYHYLD